MIGWSIRIRFFEGRGMCGSGVMMGWGVEGGRNWEGGWGSFCLYIYRRGA